MSTSARADRERGELQTLGELTHTLDQLLPSEKVNWMDRPKLDYADVAFLARLANALWAEVDGLREDLAQERAAAVQAEEVRSNLIRWQEQEIARLKEEGSPGVMHAVDKAFYELTVVQRNTAWAEVEQLKQTMQTMREQRFLELGFDPDPEPKNPGPDS